MRLLSSALIVAGLGLVAWSGLVWRFGDPVTAVWYRFEQHRLEAGYERRTAEFDGILGGTRIVRLGSSSPAAVEPPSPPTWGALRSRLARASAAYRRSLAEGGPVGVVVVPRLGLRTVVVDGTGTADLRKGPGLDPRSRLPGQGGLTYLAGHRTTFGAPFAAIDTILPGDAIELRLPYATFRYVVTGHRIVEADDVSALRGSWPEQLVLQACHPRFFASHRYLVDARLSAVVVRSGRERVAVRYAAPPRRDLALSGRRSPSTGS